LNVVQATQLSQVSSSQKSKKGTQKGTQKETQKGRKALQQSAVLTYDLIEELFAIEDHADTPALDEQKKGKGRDDPTMVIDPKTITMIEQPLHYTTVSSFVFTG